MWTNPWVVGIGCGFIFLVIDKLVLRLNIMFPINIILYISVFVFVSVIMKLSNIFSRRRLVSSKKWEGFEFEETFIACNGPFDRIKEEGESALYKDRIGEQAREKGFHPRLVREDRISYHEENGYKITYKTDKRTWRRKIKQKEMYFMIKRKDE